MTFSVNIPEPQKNIFSNGICHPDLYLWDAWSYKQGDTLHLYCLAINRFLPNGSTLLPKNRNDYPFHIRHFTSIDSGQQWRDEGAFQTPTTAVDKHDSRNVWSGSIHALTPNRQLAAYTGLREIDGERPFLQSLAVGQAINGRELLSDSQQLLLCPLRDEKLVREAGYFLGEQNTLGSKHGENSGPILAWRDPYCFKDTQADEEPLFMVWAAKVAAKKSALGMARLNSSNDDIQLETLLPPVTLPGEHLYTQMELPKILVDSTHKRYLLLVATTTRESEAQSDREVEKCIRLYHASSVQGPWQMAGRETSAITGLDHQFGMTVLEINAEKQTLLCIAPYTEAADRDIALSFAPGIELNLSDIGQVDTIHAVKIV